MTGSPQAGSRPAGKTYTPVGTAPRRPLSRRLLFLLLAGALADVGLARLGLNPMSGYRQLLPFLVLGLYALVFAAVFYAIAAGEIALRAASLTAFLERHRRLAASLLIGAGIAGALAAVWVLRAFPNSGDEDAYLFAAKTFLAGRLWNPLPPLPALFAHWHLLYWHGKWVTTYPPGWPLLLAAVMGLRLPPWLASPLLGGVLLFAALKLGERRDGPLGGLLAAALIALCPFFLFNAASYFDVLPAATAGLLFCWAGLAFLDRPRWSSALAAGAALGLLGLIRSQDALLFGLPFAGQFLLRAGRRHYRLAPGIALAGLPFLAALLFYNHAVFGSLLPNTVNIEYPGVRFGLYGVNEGGLPITPLTQLKFIAERAIILVNWSSLPLLFGYAAALAFAVRRRRLDFLDFIAPAYVLGFMLVPFQGGNQYGPRYYFEAFPLLVLTIVSALVPLLRDPRFLRWRPSALSLTAAHFAACLAALAVIVPFARAVVDQRMDIYDQVRAKHLRNAVVVIRSATGAIPDMGMEPRDLTRNGIAANGRVLYVLDLPDKLQQLRRLLPDRQFYVYKRDPADPKGDLRRLW